MNNLLTNSCIYSFKACRRRCWFAYECGIRSITDAKALRMGTAGHAALEALARGLLIDTAHATVLREYRECPEQIEQYDWQIECQTMLTLIGGYHWHWGDALKYETVEIQFRLPLRNPATGRSTPNFDIAGKIDGLPHLEDGRLAVIEHKFLSDSLDSDSDLWRILERDPQITLYLYAARELGYPVETILYDVVRKPTIKPTDVPILDDDGLKIVLDADGDRVLTKQNKPRQTGDKEKGWTLQSRPMTPAEWGEKLNADIGARPEYYFARHEIPRLDNDIAEYLEELWQLQKIIRDAQLKNRWYRTASKDTCPWCAYQGICSNGFDPQVDALPEGFVRLEFSHPELGDLPDDKCSSSPTVRSSGSPTTADSSIANETGAG